MNHTTTRFIAAMTTAFALLLAPQIASAGECGSGANVASEIWKEFGTEAKRQGCKNNQECLDNRDKREKMIKRLVSFWNKMAGNSWAKIGPRELKTNARHDGKVVSRTHRVFVTKAPLEKDSMSLTITRTKGKGPAEITVCRADDSGASKIKRVSFGAKEKKKTISFKSVKDQLVIVKIQGKKTAKSFGYSMRATSK